MLLQDVWLLELGSAKHSWYWGSNDRSPTRSRVLHNCVRTAVFTW